MEKINNIENISNLKENKIVCSKDAVEMRNTNICFEGKGNILYLESGGRLVGCNIIFGGNDSIVYISASRSNICININIFNQSSCYIGKNCYFNSTLNISCSERKNVIIGDNCLFSFGIFLRTSDPHLIYDSNSHKRRNESKSIYIGDHVWVGQNTTILKGTKIGSGSIIGAMGLVTGILKSNCSYGGNPVKTIATDIFWKGDCVHKWTESDTENNDFYYGDDFIYEGENGEKHYTVIEEKLNRCIDSNQRMECIINFIVNFKYKNRFSI